MLSPPDAAAAEDDRGGLFLVISEAGMNCVFPSALWLPCRPFR